MLNTDIPYIPTVTVAGHTGIYTGSVPAIHGIASSNFFIQATGKDVIHLSRDIVSKNYPF